MKTWLVYSSVLVAGVLAAAACSSDSETPAGGTGAQGGSGAASSGGSFSGGSTTGGTGATGATAGTGASTSGGSGGVQDPAGGTGGLAGSLSGGSAGQAVAGSGGASGGSGGLADAGVPDVSFDFDAGNQDSGFDPDASCASTVVEGELSPLDLYIMLDQSLSMANNEVSPGVTRWDAITVALDTFLSAPASAGIGVGIQFFPAVPRWTTYRDQCSGDPACGAFGPCEVKYCAACDTALYSDPAVQIAALPANYGTLMSVVDVHDPFGNTPTRPALEGAIQYAQTWATGHPGHTVAVVLATDGEPQTCAPDTIDAVAQVAQQGLAAATSIRTFVIGMGNVVGLDAIAAAGGTSQAFVVTDASATTQFAAAMEDVRRNTLGCEFVMPTPSQGIVDPTQVQLEHHKGDGSVVTYDRVTDRAACGSGGWYYDNNANPRRLLMCPESCTEVQADSGGTVKVSLGCLGS